MSLTNRVLVTDFDGTMTQHDFYSLVEARLLPADVHDYWSDYRAGKLTHFEALQAYFAAIRCDESEVIGLLAEMQLEDHLSSTIAMLARHGWKVVVASAGCDWYIQRLFTAANVQVDVHANPGRFEPRQGLHMDLPMDSPFFSHEQGIDKAGIVTHFQKSGAMVAFAGDGFPDVAAARLVPSHLRFARRDLAQVLSADGESYHPFERWTEIAQMLTSIS